MLCWYRISSRIGGNLISSPLQIPFDWAQIIVQGGIVDIARLGSRLVSIFPIRRVCSNVMKNHYISRLIEKILYLYEVSPALVIFPEAVLELCFRNGNWYVLVPTVPVSSDRCPLRAISFLEILNGVCRDCTTLWFVKKVCTKFDEYAGVLSCTQSFQNLNFIFFTDRLPSKNKFECTAPL